MLYKCEKIDDTTPKMKERAARWNEKAITIYEKWLLSAATLPECAIGRALRER